MVDEDKKKAQSNAFLTDYRIHAHYVPTATGRLVQIDPPLQMIPKAVDIKCLDDKRIHIVPRELFVAAQGGV